MPAMDMFEGKQLKNKCQQINMDMFEVIGILFLFIYLFIFVLVEYEMINLSHKICQHQHSYDDWILLLVVCEEVDCL